MVLHPHWYSESGNVPTMMPPQPPQFVGHALFSPGVLERAPAQAFLAIACTISLAILWWFFPAPSLEALAAAPIIISTAILLTIWAVRFPFSVALGLVFFTYFKFDDAFPVLSAFKLVFV